MPEPTAPSPEPSPDDAITEAKAALRADLLARRRALADELGVDGRASLADRLATAGMAWLSRYAEATGRADAPRGWTVTAYESRRTEPPMDRLVEDLRAAGLRVLMPITLPAGRLDWFDADDPDTTPLGSTALAEVDVAFTPGLAVDPRGARIGKGGGYYDRALRSLRPDTPTLTVLHGHELLDHVPDLSHDTRVSGVLTVDGVRRVGASPLPAE